MLCVAIVTVSGWACSTCTLAVATDTGGLASRLSAPWPGLQTDEGRFHDYISGGADGSGRYGEAMLGYALLQTGLRDANAVFVDCALRAIGFVLRHPEIQEEKRSVFEMYALAAAYNLARTRLPGDAHFAALAPVWALRLQSERPVWLGGGRNYINKSIVEAAAVLELLRTGIRSPIVGTWLHDHGAARARVDQLINRTLPRRAPSLAGRVMLSDPPHQPLAYHALSLGFYAEAVRLLGREADRSARRVLLGAARASVALTGPDGDLAYVGRSQEQAWALAHTALGAEAAARLARPDEAKQLRALASRTLERLTTAHPIIAGGLAIVPAFATPRPIWYSGIDNYAAAALNLAAELGVAGSGGRIAADTEGALKVGAQAGDMAVLRRGPVWLAVRRIRSRADLRYDFGLVALKLLGPDGWRDVIPLRPLAIGSSAGPNLLAVAEHEPFGSRVSASTRSIRVLGGFGGIPGRVTFTYVPTPCGVELRFRSAASATYRYSTFFRAASAPRAEGDRSVTGYGQRLTVNAPAAVELTRGFSSATEPDLVRADLTFAADRSDWVRIDTCGW
jgi:hypothetical protein